MNLQSRTIFSFSIIILIGFGSFANGGAIWSYENGSPETGTASAGFAARAQDAATAFGNPAAMVLLDSLNFLAGLPINISSIKFSIDSATYGGGNGGNAGKTMPFYGIYYVNQILPHFLPHVKAGYSQNSYICGYVSYNGLVGRVLFSKV